MLDRHGHKLWSVRVRAAVIQDMARPLRRPVASTRVPALQREAPGGCGRAQQHGRGAGRLANGVAIGPGGGLLVSTAQGRDDELVAYGPP